MPVVGYCRNLYNNLCPCFVCWKKFSLDNGVEDMLTHICFTHRIIIENMESIADFKKYMEYYAQRCRETSIENFTREIIIEVPEEEAEPREQKYYLLGDFMAEDKDLRKSLHSKRLKAAQKQQKKELSERIFIRHCFYCHQTIRVTNAQLINHLRSHGFQLGHPEKLVYIENFVESIEDTFRTLHCLYCDVKFESCRTLVTHMQEKNHMKIHPNNRFYDQFYMINYVEFGKTWMDFVKEKGKPPETDPHTMVNEVVEVDDDVDWSSWGTEPESIMCLFCKHVCRSWDGALLHMLVSHNFDFKANISHLTFYQQVKVVNFIRRRVVENKCINCETQFENSVGLISHMERNNHLYIPRKESWNHSDYFFCTMENDMFLYHLEDQDEKDESEDLATELPNTATVAVSANILHQQYETEESESGSGRSSFSREPIQLSSEEELTNDTEKLSPSPNKVEDKETQALGDNVLTHLQNNTVIDCMGAGDSAQAKLNVEEQETGNREIKEFGDGASGNQ